ncbi:MAG: DUF3817 domain-containing protein [Flavobacteriaceae bacterium]
MIKTFKIIALLEGISFILLIVIGLPLKYNWENDIMVKLMGYPHGFLAIAYVVLAILIKKELKWTYKDLIIVLICSLIPFATFWMSKKYLRDL